MIHFKFYLITDRLNSTHDPEEWLPRLASGGLEALQVREKDLSPVELDEYCRMLQASLAMQNGAPRFFLNDRADIAYSLGFAGVHLTESSMCLRHQAPVLKQSLLWGVSTHSLECAKKAEEEGADFITFGPVYETPSKAKYGPPVGLKELQKAARALDIPVFALGGVTPDRVPECLASGAHGVAAISAIWNAKDPLEALESFKVALGGL